jgi:hypothetical protein
MIVGMTPTLGLSFTSVESQLVSDIANGKLVADFEIVKRLAI